MRDAVLGVAVVVLGATLGYVGVLWWLANDNVYSTKGTATTVVNKNVMTKAATAETDTDCRKIKQELDLYSWQQLNQVRRRVALENPSCFQELYPVFADKFRARHSLNHQARKLFYYLHIPKTAGTSMCHTMQHHNFSTPHGSNCNYYSLAPYWCCASKKKLNPPSCEALTASGYNFVANERWLDYEGDHPMFCKDWNYIISVREPLARVASHVDMWHRAFDTHTLLSHEERKKRLDVIQSNYMTWSLISGSRDTDAPDFHVQTSDHLQGAKAVLRHFDFILDMFSEETSSCLQFIWEFIGVQSSNGTANQVSPTSVFNNNGTADNENTEDYQRMNAQDMELYEYAQELIRIDCDFFQRINKDS